MPPTLFVSDDRETPRLPGVPVIPISDYIREAPAGAGPGTVVMNGGRSHGYLTPGYYVSLLAEARGHRPLPSTRHILAGGTARHSHRASARRIQGAGNFTLGVLATPGEPWCASSSRSLADFARAAKSCDLDVICFDKTRIEDVARIDALFIRDLVAPDDLTFRFACRAAELGIPVVDDPDSIIRCENKVFVHERLKRCAIPAPLTLAVTPDLTADELAAQLGLPFVLKVPNGSFCLGVHKIDSGLTGERLLAMLRRAHPVLIAQEYMPTPFDWRIGILDGAPLYACKYYMARGHWQVIKHAPDRPPENGKVESVPLAAVPPALLACAARAASAIGNGLYGVDVKERDGAFFVIEVNANPDLDSGFEIGDREWLRLAEWFRSRIEQSRCAETPARALTA